MTTVPGFSSRSTASTFQQFPQRDEAAMTQEIDEALHAPGFSNSAPVDEAPADVHPEIPEPEVVDPGFSNSKAVTVEPEAEPVAADDKVEDKPAKPAKKTPAKKG